MNRVARLADNFGRPLVALALALLCGAVAIALIQRDVTAPIAAYGALLRGAVGEPTAWANTLRQTTPLLLTGAAVAVGLAAGMFNIGGEGQMAVGALTAAATGAGLAAYVPSWLVLPAALVVGLAAGSLWAFLPAYLRVTRGAHEVITAILLNYVAQNTTRYLATYPLKDPAGDVPQTALVGATLPRLVAGYDVHAGLIVAGIAVAFVAYALRGTVWGYETRAVGEGPDAAEAAGIVVGRTRITAMLLSGALAGLAGAVTVLGEVPFRRFPADFYGVGYGFDGLAVAMLAGGSAWAILPSSLLFGGLAAGAEAMAFHTGTPKQIVQVVQACLIVAVAARFAYRRRGRR